MNENSSRRQALKIMAGAPCGWLAGERLAFGQSPVRIPLSGSVIQLERGQPSYVEYCARNLASFLSELTGTQVPIDESGQAKGGSVISIGPGIARQYGFTPASAEMGPEGYVLRTRMNVQGPPRVIAAGSTSKGTRAAVIALMQRIQYDGRQAFVEAPLNISTKPSYAMRGLHLNGWAFNNPYTFRTWPEESWKKFVDLIAYQGANLFFIWPFMEIIPLPLSSEDEAYLQEVRRVVDYAHKNHGMEIWIMHAPNRIGVSDCNSKDPRPRLYWVNNCELDMNPADPGQFEKGMESIEALYRIVNNADGYGMIDSDPGGWPQSPLSDQVKIFAACRKLLDQHNIHGRDAKLIDWMWIGWGRHKYLNSNRTVAAEYDWDHTKNPDAEDVAFMRQTIQAFRKNLHEPLWLIAGFPPYLRSSRDEGELPKTVFMPYGAIEGEPSFPRTNLPLDPVRKSVSLLAEFPGVAGIMGNNETPLLQLPRTYYVLASANDYDYRKKTDDEVLLDLAGQLYPGHRQQVKNGLEALRATDSRKISEIASQLESIAGSGAVKLGLLGRCVFPDPLQVMRDLVSQLRIRERERVVIDIAFANKRAECAQAVESYLDALLAWNRQTGWEKLIDVGMWRQPIYPSGDKEFMHAMAGLKRTIAGGPQPATYDQIAAFFDPIGKHLSEEYGSHAAMSACVEPMKLAVMQAA